jgi:hypothetical protein
MRVGTDKEVGKDRCGQSRLDLELVHTYYAEKAIQQRLSQTKSEADDNPVFDFICPTPHTRTPNHTSYQINTYM